MFGAMFQIEATRILTTDPNLLVAAQTEKMQKQFGAMGRKYAGYKRYRLPNRDETLLVYTGKLFKYSQSDNAWKAMKFIFPLLILIMLSASVAVLTFRTSFSNITLVTALDFLSAAAAVYLIWSALYQESAPREMTQFRRSIAVKRFRQDLGIVCALQLAATAVLAGFAISKGLGERLDAVHIVLRSAAALCAALLIILEFTRRCQEVENIIDLPQGAKEI